jgi:iron complex transport system substrate-binding protein
MSGLSATEVAARPGPACFKRFRLRARAHRGSDRSRHHRIHSIRAFVSLGALLCVVLVGLTACGSSSTSASSRTQTITDAAGRVITVPLKINHIVMVGAPPDIDGFVIAVGDENLIVNGVPKSFSDSHFGWKILAPRLVKAPNVESTIEGPVNPEELLALKPDVVLTNDPTMADQIQKLGVPTVCITEENPGPGQEIAAMKLVGQVLHKQQAASAYVNYFTQNTSLVARRIASIPAAQRPSVLYLATMPLRRNGPAMEWILKFLGATDVAGNDPPLTQFTTEQILAWNPDFIIAHDPLDVPLITKDSVLRRLKASQDGHVTAIPQDLNEWGDFGVGDALSVLWTAKYLYPQRFADINMTSEAKAFYKQFFHINLSTSDLNEILYGIGGSKVNFGS